MIWNDYIGFHNIVLFVHELKGPRGKGEIKGDGIRQYVVQVTYLGICIVYIIYNLERVISQVYPGRMGYLVRLNQEVRVKVKKNYDMN
jgi:hypothetical protein